MILHIISIQEDKIKTSVIPFTSINSIDFEYEKDDVKGKDIAEMVIRYNSNCSDLTISDKGKEVGTLLFRIFKEDCDNEYEATSIKAFEKDFIKAMTEPAINYNIT